MRRMMAAFAVVAALVVPGAAGAGEARVPSGDWPLPRHDPARTAWNPTETVLGPGNVARLQQVGEVAALPDVAAPLLAGDLAVVVSWTFSDSEADRVDAYPRDCFGERGCQPTWSRDDLPLYQSAGAVSRGLVVLTVNQWLGDRSGIVALDAATGSTRWFVRRQGGGIYADDAVTVAGATVYACGPTLSTFMAIDLATGRRRWSSPTGADCDAQPAVAGDTVYAASTGPRGRYTLSALDRTTGARRWRRELASFGSSPMVAGGIVYVTGQRESGFGRFDHTYAFDAADGDLRWTSAVTTGDSLSSMAAAGGLVYVPAANVFDPETPHRFHALDGATGTLVWQGRTLSVNADANPAVANGVVYVASRDHVQAYVPTASCARARWCEPVWSAKVPGATGTGLVVADGRLYAGSPGRLLVFGLPG